TGSPVLSSGETNASMDPSGESAMWLMLISSDPGRENCMRVVGSARRARNHVAAATPTIAKPMAAQKSRCVQLGAAAVAARAAAFVSLPERALSANERSRAD